MTVRPLVDLLILLATGSLLVGFVLKAVEVATVYTPAILGFSANDFALVAMICFAFALTLIARTWLRLNEPGLMALRRRIDEEHARERAARLTEQSDLANGNGNGARGELETSSGS